MEDREEIRRAYYIDHKSIRQIAREQRRSRRTVAKALMSAEPERYTLKEGRAAPVLGPYKARLDEYLKERSRDGPERIFLNYQGQPISVTGIQLRLAHYCRQAGIWITCHQLRHTYATRMIGADVPITSVQKLLGHNSIHTTQLYVHVADSKVEKDYRAAVLRIIKGSLPGKEVVR